MAESIAAPPIAQGYAYAIRIELAAEEEPPFPTGTRLRAQVRRFSYSPSIIAELTTENGGLLLVADNTVEIRMTEAQTSSIGGCSVMLDLVRTDVDPDAYQYIRIRLPVIEPITRPV